MTARSMNVLVLLLSLSGCGGELQATRVAGAPDAERLAQQAEAYDSSSGALITTGRVGQVVGGLALAVGVPTIVGGAVGDDRAAVTAGAVELAGGATTLAMGYWLVMEGTRTREQQIAMELRAYALLRAACVRRTSGVNSVLDATCRAHGLP